MSRNHGFTPIKLVDVERRRPIGPIEPGSTAGGRSYGRVQILVRDGGAPAGTVLTDLPPGGLTSAEVTALLADVPPAAGPDAPLDDQTPITVVIATHHRPGLLRRCLESMRRQTHRTFRVVVVENTPEPSDGRVVATDAPPGLLVDYVHEPVPGLARAHNAGLRLVDTEFVAFTDDDVEAEPEWLATVTGSLSSSQMVGCVTGLIYPRSLDHEAQYLTERFGFTESLEPRTFDLGANRPDDRLFPFTVGSCGSGANMSFRTSVLRQIGGFDPALGAGSPGKGGDDLAAFYDVLQAGHRIVYQPAAIVRHNHDPDPARLRRQVQGYGTGLGAFLTRCVITRPRTAVTMAALIPGGALHFLSTGRGTNPTGPRLPILPRTIGLALGPAAYVRGRRRPPGGATPP